MNEPSPITRREVRVRLQTGNEAVYLIVEQVSIETLDRCDVTRYGKLVATKFVTTRGGWYLTPKFTPAGKDESARLDAVPLLEWGEPS